MSRVVAAQSPVQHALRSCFVMYTCMWQLYPAYWTWDLYVHMPHGFNVRDALALGLVLVLLLLLRLLLLLLLLLLYLLLLPLPTTYYLLLDAYHITLSTNHWLPTTTTTTTTTATTTTSLLLLLLLILLLTTSYYVLPWGRVGLDSV